MIFLDRKIELALYDYIKQIEKKLYYKENEMDIRYKVLYQENGLFSLVMSYIHFELDSIFEYINSQNKPDANRDNIYIHADNSRLIIDFIRYIDEINHHVKEEFNITLHKDYQTIIDLVLPQLQYYDGSTISKMDKIKIMKYEEVVFLEEFKKPKYGNIMNIIFGANKYKPEIILDDALENKIEIVKNKEYCLIYDKDIKNNSLTWGELSLWWTSSNSTKLSEVLLDIYDSGFSNEKKFLQSYLEYSSKRNYEELPALIPEVYLHYDPKTLKQLTVEKEGKRLIHQRMDFLMLINGNRIIIELDGKQHYSDGDKSSPKKYADMVSYDRKMKLLGYDIFRFGGQEFLEENFKEKLYSFFNELLDKYSPHLKDF